MAMPSSQKIRSESEMVPELRPVMPVDLFRAVMKGDSDVLIRRLRLQPAPEQTECQVIGPMPPYRSLMPGTTQPMMVRNIMPEILRSSSFSPAFPSLQVTIEAPPSAPEEVITKNQTVQSELQSATRSGDTILHLLITKEHNELALKVFQRDMSLLKARNYMLETPLYCAAKVGNEKVIHNLIQSDRVVVKDALEERKKNGDTALHVAAQHGHRDIGRLLMNLDPELAYKVNDEMKSPFYMAIIEGTTRMVQTMLEVDPNLACTPFSDGMFPVHVAACNGYHYIVNVFIKNYPDDAEFQDSRGRNLLHIAAEENYLCIFSGLFEDARFKEMREKMNSATNYEGDTPFHIAAKKGHKSIMRTIWEHYQVAETVPNSKGFTPFQLSTHEVVRTNEDIDDDDISIYIGRKGDKFTCTWFDEVMESPLENKWDRTQVIGLGSVLITTVAFAAAFTIPGGHNQENGTPVLGRRYMFRAFILANAMAFIQGFLSLFALLVRTMSNPRRINISFAQTTFLYAASSMVMAFGLGMYVTLAPVCYPIAILLVVITLVIGSPTVFVVLATGQSLLRTYGNNRLTTLIPYVVFFMFIFCLALM